MTPASRSARLDERPLQRRRSRSDIASISSRTQSRRSVETWSLRLRPVWSLRPTSPIRSIERPLDVHVDVFQLLAELELAGGDLVADLLQAGDDLVPLVVGEHADLGEHVGVGDRAADVVGVEPAVEAHAFGELLDAAVRRLIKNTTPRLGCQRMIPAYGRAMCARAADSRATSNMFTVNTLRRIVNDGGSRRPKNRQRVKQLETTVKPGRWSCI